VVSSAEYCAILDEELKPTIYRRYRGMLTDGVFLHHDNTQPHMTVVIIETIEKTEIQASPLPNIQSRSLPICLLYFQTTESCVMWTPIFK